MKKLVLALILVWLFPSLSFAHPGRTASDGCHYCRTNCSKWGEISGQRHCHNRKETVIKQTANPFEETKVKPKVSNVKLTVDKDKPEAEETSKPRDSGN